MKKWMKSLTAVMVAVSLIGGASSAVEAKSNLKGNIVINGSSALLPLTLQAASEFKKENPKVKISASAAGSITGPQSVRKGIADIGAVDWDASKNVPGFNKFDGLVANPVAVTVFTAVANPNVGVNSLTTKQLQDIFSGKVTNWKEVGGSDAKIVVVNRKFGSGTRVNFQQKALDGKEFMNKGDNYKEVGSSGDMKTTIETTPNAIGYID
ncbi:substrate-binding domain-containing protein, partial [Paenibacillus glucanolyticus]